MRLAVRSFAICLLFLMPGICRAQQGADPFGTAAADPFADRPAVKDPFGASQPKRAKPKVAQPKLLAGPGEAKGKLVAGRMQSDASARIRATLGDETSQSFVDVPLEEAVSILSRSHNIPMLVDSRALEEVGLTTDAPVTIDLRNIKLRSFLRLMLRSLELTYMVQDEVLQVTTIEAAEQRLLLEMYKFPPELLHKSEQIVKALTLGVVPVAWNSEGGPCSVTAIENVLIVSATEQVHDGVIEFLKKLDQAFEKE